MKIIVGVAQKNGKFAMNKGLFNSCVDRILSFFDHPTISVDQGTKRGQKWKIIPKTLHVLG